MMSWERIGIMVMDTEHRASGDSKNRAAPQGMWSREWTWGSECPNRAQSHDTQAGEGWCQQQALLTAQQSSDQAKSGPFMSGVSKSGIAEVRNRAGSTYSLVQSRSAAQDLSCNGASGPWVEGEDPSWGGQGMWCAQGYDSGTV